MQDLFNMDNVGRRLSQATSFSYSTGGVLPHLVPEWMLVSWLHLRTPGMLGNRWSMPSMLVWHACIRRECLQ